MNCKGGLLGFGGPFRGPSGGQGSVVLAGWVQGQLWGVLVGLGGAGWVEGHW